MFGMFSTDPKAKLEKRERQLREQAMQAQRGGDVVRSAELGGQADEIAAEIRRLEMPEH